MRSAHVIRELVPADFDAVVAINTASYPAMKGFTRDELHWLVERSAYARVVEDDGGLAGFLLGLPPGTGYDSANYRWFEERFTAFLYVDRIAIAARAQRRRLGSLLYDDIAAFARGRWPRIVAEVNRDPPNPDSERFHVRHGFAALEEVHHTYPGAYAARVVMMERVLSESSRSDR